LGLVFLVGLVLYLKPKVRPFYWWSVLFTNPLKKTANLTNVLLLGVSGGDHDGADLTDTMILLSFNHQTSQISLTTIPRDIWMPSLVAKINTAYHYGEEKKPGGGFILAKAAVEEVTGLAVHYTAKIDFTGFKEFIDLLGGVEVKVERSFDDYKYPIEGRENDPCDGDPQYLCRYQHIHFDAGLQLLNGERALQYVRSRNAEGDEGTDFARSRRQEKLILAIKNKIFSKEFFLRPKESWQTLKSLEKVFQTDISQDEFIYFGKMLAKFDLKNIKTLSLEEFLINPPVGEYEQWVLTPKDGDFTSIYRYLKEQTKK
jgi:LCP family protein required for cell wall assembly